jgi:polygalacturonase
MKKPIVLICCLVAPAAFAQTSTAVPVHHALTLKPSDIVVTSPPYNAQCNGTADDTAALNAAAAAANAAGGGTVSFPTGVCTTSTGIPIYSNVTYAGQGVTATTVALLNGSNKDVFYGTSNGYGSTMVNYASGYQT